MTTLFNVKEPYKSLILQGKKTVEGRLNKGKFADLCVGAQLQFEETGELLEVVSLTPYVSFQSMLESEGLKHVLPWMTDIESGVAVYHQFYTSAQEAEFGVLAIEVKVKN